jgi:hypothetical protein
MRSAGCWCDDVLEYVLALQEVAIVVIGQTSHEGADRSTLSLDQSDLVTSVAAAQRNTIVVAISPGPFLTPWRASVAAIVDFGFPGEQAGGAVVDVLFGDVNPAGKSPHTMPTKENEMEMTPRQYPGIGPPDSDDAAVTGGGFAPCANPVPTDSATGLNPQGGTGGSDCVPTKAYYDERLLVGYRWYDQHQVTPAFPFGAKRQRLCYAFRLSRQARGKHKRALRNTHNLDAAVRRPRFELHHFQLLRPAGQCHRGLLHRGQQRESGRLRGVPALSDLSTQRRGATSAAQGLSQGRTVAARGDNAG